MDDSEKTNYGSCMVCECLKEKVHKETQCTQDVNANTTLVRCGTI